MMTLVVMPAIRSMADGTAPASAATESQNLRRAFDRAKKEKKNKVLPVTLTASGEWFSKTLGRPCPEGRDPWVGVGDSDTWGTGGAVPSARGALDRRDSGIIVARVLPLPLPPPPPPKPAPIPPPKKCRTVTRRVCKRFEVNLAGIKYCAEWETTTVEVCD